MKNALTILIAVASLLSFSTLSLAQTDDTSVILVDNVTLFEHVEIPAGLPSGIREIPCNIVDETPDEVTIDISTNKNVPRKITIKKSLIKVINRGGAAPLLYNEIKNKLATLDPKLKDAKELSLPFTSASESFYKDLIEKDVDLIIQKYPNFPNLDEVKSFREKVLAEIEQIKQGKIRTGDKWISADEYELNKANYVCMDLIDKINAQPAPFPPKLFLEYVDQLETHKSSSNFPKAVKALQDATYRMTTDSVDKLSGAENLEIEKTELQEKIDKKQSELSKAEDELQKLISTKVEELDNAWSTTVSAKTASGKKYNQNDVRTPEQSRALITMSKYLSKGSDDLPYSQLSEVDMEKAKSYYKSIKDMTLEMTFLKKDLSQLDKNFEARQRELQNKIKNATKKILSGSYNRYSQAMDSFGIFKASYKLFKESPSSDPNEINKIMSPLIQIKQVWPENIDVANQIFEVGTFLLDKAKEEIAQKNYRVANVFIQQAERMVSDLRIVPDSPLAKINIAYRTNLMSIKNSVGDSIQSDRDAKLAGEKRLKEIMSTIDSLNKAKDWGGILALKAEAEPLDTQNRLKTAFDLAVRNQNLSSNHYKDAVKSAKAGKFDEAMDLLRQGGDLWPNNPAKDEIKPAIIAGYKKSFASKEYENAIKWLDIASSLKTEDGSLNVNEEIDKCTQLIDEAKKQKIIMISSIAGGVLVVVLIIAFVVKLVLSKKKNTVPAPVIPAPAPAPHHPQKK